MNSRLDIKRNKLMYGVYNVETLEKLIRTIYILHSRQSMYKKLFAGQIIQA